MANLTYLGYCVSEALRCTPPVAISSDMKVTEDI